MKMSHTLALLIASGALLGIPAAAAAADAGADTGAAMSGQIGQSRTLLDQDGNKMRVTLVGYVASYTRFDATYEAPDAGKRYVGVRFVVKNLGLRRRVEAVGRSSLEVEAREDIEVDRKDRDAVAAVRQPPNCGPLPSYDQG